MDITVEKIGNKPDYVFQVQVDDMNSSSRHIVNMSYDFYSNLNTKMDPKEIIKWSFEFLLQKEPKESILSEFDVTVISKYFPEYSRELNEFTAS